MSREFSERPRCDVCRTPPSLEGYARVCSGSAPGIPRYVSFSLSMVTAGITFAQIICDVRYGGKTLEEAMEPFLAFYTKKW